MLIILQSYVHRHLLRPIARSLCFKGIFQLNNMCSQQDLLQNLQQQAIIAYHVMENIRQLAWQKPYIVFSKQSIMNRVMQKSKLWNQIQENLGNYWHLRAENLDKVWQGFNITIGAAVDLDIWCHNNFTEAAKSGRIVLMPTHITGNIFNQLMISQNMGRRSNPEYVRDRFAISGQKGIGKSFAYLIYDYLSQFIISYRIRQQGILQSRLKRLCQLVNEKEFKYVKKILYIPLIANKTLAEISDYFAAQARSKIKQINGQQSIGQKIKRNLTNIQLYYNWRHKIYPFCIIDDFNLYQNSFRKMLISHKKKQKTLQQQKNQSTLKLQSFIMRIIQVNIGHTIFNSSEDTQQRLINCWNKQYFDIYEHQATKIFDVQLKYALHLNCLLGQQMLYELFWKELCLNLCNLIKMNNLITSTVLREIFDQTFGLLKADTSIGDNKNQQYFPNDFIEWQIGVRHLDIRQVICHKDKTITHRISTLIKRGQELNYKREIMDQLAKIKQQVEKYRFDQVAKKFEAYSNKVVNDDVNKIRKKIIFLINEAAYQAQAQLNPINIVEQNKKALNMKNLNNIAMKRIQSNLDLIKKEREIRNKVIVDFKLILKDKQHEALDDEKQAIKKQMTKLILQVGIGQHYPKNHYCMIIIIHPTLLWEITSKIREKQMKNQRQGQNNELQKIP